ncbi:hypothetical protein A7U60_g8243 [Sanghuangporus baumii]|uniref:Uncharacterized protein n=1 Tax=Sanghuangporus baumii TaxID=108892 RepID=A0A9Q5HRV6_SANBA|nr:hypothetical protein A7U60_g8243 [Sanghuangporus baumii]
MASIIPQQRPSPHVAPNVPSPLRRASSHSSIPSTTTPGGSKLASPPHSRSSTSELGDIPGTYPRDPRIALEHLNDKADMTGTESSATNNGTILDAAREDWRHAVDVASSYLPGTVVGAFGYAFPFGTTNPEETEKKLQEGGVDRAPRESTKFKFEPKDVAVGGIVSDFNPLSSRSRATPSSTSGVGTNSNTPKKPFTSPSVGHALDSTAPKSESESNSKNDALGPTAVPASKDKKDDDVQEISIKQPQSQSSDLRKRAIETAALGAGIGTLGGAAYESSRSPAQPSSKVNPKAEDLTSPGSSGSVASEQSVKEQPAFATYAPAPETPSTSGAPTDSQPEPASKPAAPSTDTSGPKDIQKALSQSDAAGDSTVKGAEGLAVGAGAGQASSETSGTVPSQMQTPGKQGQKEEVEKDSIAPQDSKIKKGFWSAALVAGAGVLGGAALHYSHKNGEDDSSRMTEGSPASQSQSQPQHQIQPESHSKANTDQSTGAGGDKDAQSTDKKGMAAAAATGAGVGAIGTGLVSDKKSETDQHAESRKKEAEKREKDMKRHEKDSVAPVAASSSDKRSAAKKEDKRDAKEAEKQHQAAKREKEVKKHEKDVIAAEAVAGDSKRAKRAEGPKETTQSQQGEKVAAVAKTKDRSKGLAAGAAGGTALGAGTGLAANSLSDAQKHQPSDELSPATTAQQTDTDLNKSSQQQDHPSIKAASDSPHRPGPIAHGAAGPYDVPKSGADSDFPLPSANASSTDVAKAVDIDGSGKPSTAEDNKFDSKARSKSGTKTANTAAGVVTAGGAAGQYGDKSRYHASEGPQEKHEGGVLRSSTIERMKNGKNGNGDGSNGNGNGNGHGKKEGFVKHMVEKVKDKLHHHDK